MTDVYVYSKQRVGVYVPAKAGSTSWRIGQSSHRIGTGKPLTFPGYTNVAIWRDPVRRFLSIYSHFVYGSTLASYDAEWLQEILPARVFRNCFLAAESTESSLLQFIEQVFPLTRDLDNFNYAGQESFHLYTAGFGFDQFDLTIDYRDQTQWAQERLGITLGHLNTSEWIYPFAPDAVPESIETALRTVFPEDFISVERLYK